MDSLSRLSIETTFISATSVTIENGLTNSAYLEAESERSIVQWENRAVLMAGQGKFGHSAVISFCSFEQLRAKGGDGGLLYPDGDIVYHNVPIRVQARG